MYRIIFEQHPREGQEKDFIEQWQKGSDIIQTYPGARGTKLFRSVSNPKILYAMAEWESKEARMAAVEAIKERLDAEMVLHGHEAYKINPTTIVGEFECIAESNPPSSV